MGSLSSVSLVTAAFIIVEALAATVVAGCSVGTRIPGESHAVDGAGAGTGVSASPLESVAATALAALPGFAVLEVAAAVWSAVARLAFAVAGGAGAGIKVGGAMAGGGAMGAAGGDGCAAGAAAVGGRVAGAGVGGTASGSATFGASHVFGAAVDVAVAGAGKVGTTGAVGRSAAGRVAPALPVVAAGASLAGVALSFGLAGAGGAGDGVCAPNPVSTARKSAASALAEESDAPAFESTVLALELAAPFAPAVAEAAGPVREGLPETFLRAMCGSLG
jgi:hypothetical protein